MITDMIGFTPGYPPLAWLKERLAIHQAEYALRDETREFNIAINDRWWKSWTRFKALIGDEDELWYFEHFPEPLTGAAGYCIVRDGSSVAYITTKRA
jgi:hypothetical protein